MYWIYVKLLGPLARAWLNPRVRGLNNIPSHGAAIIASNHLAAIDDVVIPITSPRMIHFMGKEEYFTGKGIKGKIKKEFFTSVGVFPVDRSGGSKSLGALEAAREILESGKLFGIHPEGTRSPDGKLYRGHTGVARLALETGSPIIPVAVKGTNIVQPKGKVFPSHGHTSVTYGSPIPVERVPADEITHAQIRELTDKMMHKIGDMSGQEYVDMYAQDRKKELEATQH